MATTPRPAYLTAPPRPLNIPALQQTRRVLGATLAWLNTLPHDSRDSLPSKDTELASYGVKWSTDLAHDTELAQQMATSRLLRRAGRARTP